MADFEIRVTGSGDWEVVLRGLTLPPAAKAQAELEARVELFVDEPELSSVGPDR